MSTALPQVLPTFPPSDIDDDEEQILASLRRHEANAHLADDEIESVLNETQRGPFLSYIPVIDLTYLTNTDQDLIHDRLIARGEPEGLTENDEALGRVYAQYVEWNTGWMETVDEVLINDILFSRGLPDNLQILLKTY